jgi:hypothetical protein
MNNSWKIALGTFVIGVVLGVAGGMFGLHPLLRKGMREGKRVEWLVRHLDRELTLTGEQKSKVVSILNENEAKIRALHEDMKPRFEDIRKNTRDLIRQVLRPDQQTRFDQWNAKWESRMARWHPRREPGMPPPPPPPPEDNSPEK